ncbi:hypothetical protein CN135_32545 [Sinorhizobium meliloti]|uniref:hypothetical protein n=1 Tax=Rhizobium meliloti TaxID=382 RepID=UPI000FD91A29|nr:hypothetical protein [Sinorhizobium meliloti]RVL70065.1 hypothetical protein CN135_32545 [Sinorhizobium meliloti]
MDDSEAKSAGRTEPAPDLSEIAAQCAASNLLDFAEQLAGLAEDLKALAATPIEPTLAASDDQPEASSQ